MIHRLPRLLSFAALFSSALAMSQSLKLDSGLVAHYTFDNQSSDVTKNGHDGISYNVTPASGHCGSRNSALFFNGQTSYIEVPDHADLRPKVLSIAYWINLYSSDAGVIFFKSEYSNAANEQYSMPYNHYKISGLSEQKGFHFGIKRPGYCASPGYGWDATYSQKEQPLNTWHFVVAQFDGKLLKIYVNGELLSESASSYSEISNCAGGSLKIGKAWQNFPVPFYGLLDEFRIYNRALSFNEIKALYADCPITTGIEEEGTNDQAEILRVQSNPSQSGVFEISNASGHSLSSQVFDPLGGVVETRTLHAGTTLLDLSRYPSGMYVVKTEKGNMKLIIN